jgi:hypothetical protein
MWLIRRLLGKLSLLAGVFGLGFIMSWVNSRKAAKIEKLKDYKETRKDVDDGDAEFDEVVGDDPAAARRWLRERKP